MLSARLQPGKDPVIVISEIVELLAVLDEVGIPVHEELIWLHFVDSLAFRQVRSSLRTTCQV